MTYRLLDAFRGTFEGQIYRHRSSTAGDIVASHMYEDLLDLARSAKFAQRVRAEERVVNLRNRRVGIRARRGDGTFGELVPRAPAIRSTSFAVARGDVATIEIGAEVKILAKAMVKQIGRVINDLTDQVDQFRKRSGDPICVGIVGINHAPRYTSYESDRVWPTDGTAAFRHPVQEAAEAEARLLADAAPSFFEFLVLRFRADNSPPFRFEWVDLPGIEALYGAALTRISREYDRRF